MIRNLNDFLSFTRARDLWAGWCRTEGGEKPWQKPKQNLDHLIDSSPLALAIGSSFPYRCPIAKDLRDNVPP